MTWSRECLDTSASNSRDHHLRALTGAVLCFAAMVGACAPKSDGETRDSLGAARSVESAKHQCAAPGSPVQVSPEVIGALTLGAPLGRLRMLCAAARPTTYQGFESTSPALEFPMDSLTAVAIQHGVELDTSKAAEAWEVRGCGGVLPKGVSTCARWSRIVAVYGDSGAGSTEFGPARIRLRALAGFDLEFDVTDSVVGSLEVQPDLSRIPPSARLVRILISPASPWCQRKVLCSHRVQLASLSST